MTPRPLRPSLHDAELELGAFERWRDFLRSPVRPADWKPKRRQVFSRASRQRVKASLRALRAHGGEEDRAAA